MHLSRILSALILMALPLAAFLKEAPAAPVVETKGKPDDKEWKTREVRKLDQLPAYAAGPAPELDRWGGWAAERRRASGFFRVEREPSGRWWLVDPDGGLFLHVGVAGVYRGTEDVARATTKKTFADDDAWAAFTLGLLRQYAFNGLGGWTEAAALRGKPGLLPYTVSLDFTADFGRTLGITRMATGHMGYVNNVAPLLHPDFAKWCEDYAAKRAAPLAGDPALVGFFSDNELPLRREMLEDSLALDEANEATRPMKRAAEAWLRERRHDRDLKTSPTDDERAAFLAHACDRYYGAVRAALRRHAPQHLYLGSRIHGKAVRYPEVFHAAGAHVDVVSVNLYHVWSPDSAQLAMWTTESGRPSMITEFYAKGADTGLGNQSGAGWLVKTQRDRGLFYQTFALGLLESGSVVGWHWFKYRDNEAWATDTDPSNRDSNKGLVSWDYKPFADALETMAPLNRQVYPLTRYFDGRSRSAKDEGK